jgi:4-diphosphocytidyl-2-C-methyl-D-erythritol kinase
MYIRASASAVEVWTPAKLNLFLEVLGRRDDGFHAIETLMMPISLGDTLFFQAAGEVDGAAEVRDSRSDIVLSAHWAGSLLLPKHGVTSHSTASDPSTQGVDQQTIPQGVDNIVVRAVELLRRRAGIDSGATIRLVKRIPLAAGLGGGSSNAAAALQAANLAWGLGYSARQLAPLAAELGSDVPFFLAGSPAVCRGRGEQVEPIEQLGAWHFVMARPPLGLSTAEVYRHCEPAQTPRNAASLVKAMREGRWANAGRLLHNQLQPAAERLCPSIVQLREEFARLGLVGHQMSGSGTSYFGICRNMREAQRAAARLRMRQVGSVDVVRSCL